MTQLKSGLCVISFTEVTWRHTWCSV